MIQSHEKGVDHNAQGNKEVDERIEDDERQVLEENKNEILILIFTKWTKKTTYVVSYFQSSIWF